MTITGQDPPVGLTGNYHLHDRARRHQISGAVDRGVRCSNASVPPPANPACSVLGQLQSRLRRSDIDGQFRPAAPHATGHGRRGTSAPTSVPTILPTLAARR